METPIRGGVYAPTAYVKVFNPDAPGAQRWLNTHFPQRFTPKSHTAASAEIHSQNKFFQSVKERELAQQLVEEGRLELEAIEPGGLPGGSLFEGGSVGASFSELFNAITHPTLGGLTLGGLFGSSQPQVQKIGTAKVGGQTLPSSHHEGSGAEHGEEEGQRVLNALGGLPWLQIAELVGGAALVMFGLVQLGQKAGLSVPSPRP